MICLPHIFNGAPSSKRIGCDKNICCDFRHNPRISSSDSWTFSPDLSPRTVENNIRNRSPSNTGWSPGRDEGREKEKKTYKSIAVAFAAGQVSAAAYLLTISIILRWRPILLRYPFSFCLRSSVGREVEMSRNCLLNDQKRNADGLNAEVEIA